MDDLRTLWSACFSSSAHPTTISRVSRVRVTKHCVTETRSGWYIHRECRVMASRALGRKPSSEVSGLALHHSFIPSCVQSSNPTTRHGHHPITSSFSPLTMMFVRSLCTGMVRHLSSLGPHLGSLEGHSFHAFPSLHTVSND